MMRCCHALTSCNSSYTSNFWTESTRIYSVTIQQHRNFPESVLTQKKSPLGWISDPWLYVIEMAVCSLQKFRRIMSGYQKQLDYT